MAAKLVKQAIQVKHCSIRLLPEQKWIPAAETAVGINYFNSPKLHQLRQVMPNIVIPPAHLSLMTSKYWGFQGVSLKVGFLDNPPTDLRKRLLIHMNAWGKFCNVKFVQSNANPQVRISRSTPAPNDGYWSYLGTDILHVDAGEATMNLDSFTMNTEDSEFFRVVRHETGHTLGFPHEHMRTEIVSGIHREKAIKYFMRTQGWSREEVIAQVLTPIKRSALTATALADPKSVMCYWLPGEIMKNGKAIPGGVDIDKLDAQFAATQYPKKKKKNK